MISELMSKDMVLRRRDKSQVGSDGRPAVSFVDVPVKGGVRFRSQVDGENGGMIVSSDWRLYFAPEVVVEPGDVVLIDGHVFEVVSEPFAAWNHRLGVVSHLEVRVREAKR